MMTVSTSTDPAESPSSAMAEPDQASLRDRAIARLKKRQDFFAHLLVYVLVNSFLVVIWIVTSGGGFF
jgi:hypothetical protein